MDVNFFGTLILPLTQVKQHLQFLKRKTITHKEMQMLAAGNQWKLTERSKEHQLVTDNDENVSKVTKFYYKLKPCLKNQRHTPNPEP